MPIYEFEGKRPVIGKGVYVSETAYIVGDVVIGDECFIGAGAAIRGDFGAVRIGNRTSIQENCSVHVGLGGRCTVGDNCTVGHGAVLHGCTIKNRVLVGMGATVIDSAVVGEDAIVGESALVRGEVPPAKIAVGVPAKVIADLSDSQRIMKDAGNEAYVHLTRRYVSSLKRID